MSEGDAGVPDPLSIRREWTPDRTGLIETRSGEEYSYRVLDNAAWSVAEWIAQSADASSPTVALLFGTRPAVAPLVFGGLRTGGRVALLDVELPPGDLATRLDRLDVDLVICEAGTEHNAAEATPDRVVSLDTPDRANVEQFAPFEESATPDSQVGRELGELIAFTSGTTGAPKGVRIELESLVASAVASALRLGVATDDRWLVPIPTYHVGGLSPIVRCTLAGTMAVLQRSFDAEPTIDAIDEFEITCTSLVPTQLTRMLDAGWNPPEQLRFVLLGGGPIPPESIERCRERDVPVCPTYGTTETASQVATARPQEAVAHPGTVGHPLTLSEVRILDDGERCGTGETGEIVVDGPTVTPGYLDRERTEAAFDDLGFHTGDLGYRDPDGRLWIEGRVDDRIVTGGENVDATRVRETLLQIDDVEDAAVVGIPDPEWGERVAALVVTERSDGTAVRQYCAQHLAGYAVPKTIGFAEELPLTQSGTIDRDRVKTRLR